MSATVVQLKQGRKQRNATSSARGRQGNEVYRVREHLTEAEIEKLLSALRQNCYGHRDWLIGLLIYRRIRPFTIDQEPRVLLQESYATHAAPRPHSPPHSLIRKLDRVGKSPHANPDLHCGNHACADFLGLNSYHAAYFSHANA
jgi:hypothetical protein